MNYLKLTTTVLFVTCSTLTHAARAVTYSINTNKPQQTIMHFGASDAWSMDKLGLWSKEKQEQIADWLFSTDNDSTGKPKGIGLSLWRFNLGAGSAEQGRNSKINRDTRTECFLQADGTYNWNKQEGQRNFIKLAKQRGVPYILAFMNSAPVYYTLNGLATNTGRDGTYNLKDSCYDDVAEFIAQSIKGLKEHDGIDINYISAINEPDGHWNWQGPKQEGSPATNREIVRLNKEISKVFIRNNITTEILGNESSDLRCLLGIHMTSWQRGNTLATLYSKDSIQTYVGDTPLMPRLILGHSYWTNTPIPYMKKLRIQLRNEFKKYGVKFWQSEICIMGNDEEIGGGGGYDFTMKTALYVARIIHHDLVFANAESWSWWRAAGGDYKDGLIRTYMPRGDNEGKAVDSRLMWALGNYSRFIRPGAIRYDIETIKNKKIVIEGETEPYGIMCSAYRNTNGKWVIVAINYSDKDSNCSMKINGKNNKWQLYRTSDADGETLKPIGIYNTQVSLKAKSITTLVSAE